MKRSIAEIRLVRLPASSVHLSFKLWVNTSGPLGVLAACKRNTKRRRRQEGQPCHKNYCSYCSTFCSSAALPCPPIPWAARPALSTPVLRRTNGAPLPRSLAGMAVPSNGRRLRPPRTFPRSSNTFLIPVSNSGCVARYGWKRRSSTFIAQKKRPYRSAWLSPKV